MGLRLVLKRRIGKAFRVCVRSGWHFCLSTLPRVTGSDLLLPRPSVLEQGRYFRFAGLLPRLEADCLVARRFGQGIALSVGGGNVRDYCEEIGEKADWKMHWKC
jgi:hypothetical protein